MSELKEDIFEELKKKSEKRNKKLKSAGKIISYLYLALFFGIGLFVAQDLGAALEWLGWYRIAGILIIVLVFSILSVMVEKKTRGAEKHATSSKLIQLLITIFMSISIYIFFSLTSKI